MEIPDFRVDLRCLFCGCALEGPEDAEYHPGDLIKCAKCGEGNDYDSVLDVAKEEGMARVKDVVQERLQETFRDLFKKK